ncbi:polysaccharide deacetylase family protein [Streptomyces sp. H10-C2]|uniref:polysaccharide deacetylase family protein n=1 Tax=unclassified Streptomyces TaxID=2593676 RepID=UPI0024B8818A|nr:MULTISPECIES: polysaccharide deacetylase family protein [unclassified Streptomyces]MDJ0346143.1 polysaccharide deacetylase family protein [Streptomyces sp. PH10-H1]MDJ0371595.1 polysaccharide deacetylase family protein [Streptomyces sp. H10-C2]
MPIERRSVLRNLSRAAAVGAAGSFLSACGDNGHATPTSPASPSAAPSTPRRGPTSSASPAPLPDQIVHGPTERPLVALTFHGQGDPALADAVLATAERAGAHLTVLAVGSWLDTYPAMARRIVDAGHDLGNHTQHHVDISAMNAAAAYAEIQACAQRLHQLTGSIGSWFRPSQSRLATPLVQQQARKAGYQHCLSYSLDSLDYTDPGAAAVQRTVLAAVHGGSVVSLHMGHPGTLGALPVILTGLKQRGLRAVTATEMLR